MPSPNQLQLAPFFCDKKAHMHSELSYINKKRVSAWLKFPTGSKINMRLSLNFTPSCSTEREVELRGFPLCRSWGLQLSTLHHPVMLMSGTLSYCPIPLARTMLMEPRGPWRVRPLDRGHRDERGKMCSPPVPLLQIPISPSPRLGIGTAQIGGTPGALCSMLVRRREP